MMRPGVKVTLHDMSLRDGMHPKQHQISLEEMITVSTALDKAGVPWTSGRRLPSSAK